jgi:hypothetical protein
MDITRFSAQFPSSYGNRPAVSGQPSVAPTLGQDVFFGQRSDDMFDPQTKAFVDSFSPDEAIPWEEYEARYLLVDPLPDGSAPTWVVERGKKVADELKLVEPTPTFFESALAEVFGNPGDYEFGLEDDGQTRSFTVQAKSKNAKYKEVSFEWKVGSARILYVREKDGHQSFVAEMGSRRNHTDLLDAAAARLEDVKEILANK